MKNTRTLKSLFVLTAFTLGAGCASAKDQCFEDGLKAPWKAPAPSIELDRGHGISAMGGQHDMDADDNSRAYHCIDVSPVSEPQSEAMLLAGLVMLASLARRKSKSASL